MNKKTYAQITAIKDRIETAYVDLADIFRCTDMKHDEGSHIQDVLEQLEDCLDRLRERY